MSDSPDAFNPYASPEEPPPGTAPVPQRRPSALTAIAIIIIVLGSFGLVSVVFGCVGILANSYVQQMVQQAQAGSDSGDPAQQANLRMQAEINQLNESNRVFYIISILAHLVVALLLIWGGILVLRVRPGADKWLSIACGSAILFEVLRGIFNLVMQVQMLNVMQEHLSEMASGPGGEMVERVTRISIYVGLAMSIFWLLGKIIFYGVSIAYVRKPEIRALFKAA